MVPRKRGAGESLSFPSVASLPTGTAVVAFLPRALVFLLEVGALHRRSTISLTTNDYTIYS